MSDHIDPWELMRRRELEQSRAAFEARPDFAELLSAARARGFRRITLCEQLDSSTDAYLWRGGVWVKEIA